MLAPTTVIGATTQGTTFSDIIINNVNGVAEGRIQGFSQFIHDPKSLKTAVGTFASAAIPKKFADAVVQRRIETQKLDDIWNFPLNMSVPTTCPIPWTLIEATQRSGTKLSPEFNIMRTVDFIGRNYIKIRLPRIDCSEVADTAVKSGSVPLMSHPDHMYLGAWHRDLIPRMIQSISFYPRSNSHKLFEYTGYDIYVHNILFGNANKEMNDLMSGEDRFELCYDPYYVNGAALGLASYKGIDAYSEWSAQPTLDNSGLMELTALPQRVEGLQDGIVDYFQVDSTMDNAEFREFYRKGVWFEAPTTKNYNVRHSIHSRRVIHQAKDISIPLDILPFGYSIASSLPSAALSGECGFIKINIYDDWLDRAFYLTKVSDIPSLHPIVNHLHYDPDDATPDGNKIVGPTDPRAGWVNEHSLGRFGDPTYVRTATEDDVGENIVFSSKTRFGQPGNVLGASKGSNLIEGIVPTRMNFDNIAAGSAGVYRQTGYSSGMASKGRANISSKRAWDNVKRHTSTVNDPMAISRDDRLLDYDYQYIHKMGDVDSAYYSRIKDELSVKLLQVGYQSLPCIRELLSKLPNIYITTEWDDRDININDANFDINNELYIQAIILWFIPVDSNGIESMRLYPNHMIDHELPIIAGLNLRNDASQGDTTYDWETLNIVNPAQMCLSPLIENMGIISFSPSLTANTLPLAYYDSNISGYLKVNFRRGEGAAHSTIGGTAVVNMKQGKCRVITIGVNGCASVNLNLFRLVF
jgi:uncharacterized protein YbjQ (UPF0145 family)